MGPPGQPNARLPRLAIEVTGIEQTNQTRPETARIATGKYSTLTAAAALARATAAHLAEALREREQLGGDATGDLVSVLLDAHLLSDALAQLAAREGGAPWAK
jgi:hypothetical protein